MTPVLPVSTARTLVLLIDVRQGVIETMSPSCGVSPEEADATPYAMVGTVDEMCDRLAVCRDRWGISY